MPFIPSYVDFNKPYPNGWRDNESGGTPISATVLNNNYDAFFESLNNWSDNIEGWIDTADAAMAMFITLEDIPTASTSTAGLVKVDGTSITIQNGVISSSGGAGGSSVSWSQIQATGTKIATITINNVDTDVYVPADTGDTVTWTQITGSGTKIATISINGTSTDVYAPTSGGGYTDVTGILTAGSTSITLSNVAITTNSTIETFNSLDIPYNSKTVSPGSVTLTFDAQQSDMGVKVRVS